MTPVETFFYSVRQGFVQQASPWWLLGVLVVVVLPAVLQSAMRSRRQRTQLLVEAHARARSQGVPQGDFQLLLKLAGQAGADPIELQSNLAVFERVSAQALAEQPPTLKIPATSLFADLHRIRRALDFHHLPAHHWLLTTRELAVGDTLSFGDAMLPVEEVNEAWFAVPAATVALPEIGSRVTFGFLRPKDATYILSCTYLGRTESETGPRAHFAHDENLKRKQQREWVRVSARIAVTLTPQLTDGPRAASPTTATSIDISAGGLALESAVEFPERALLSCRFQLAPKTAFDNLTAQIIETRPVGDKHHLRIAFLSVSETQRDRLVAAIAALEQRQRMD